MRPWPSGRGGSFALLVAGFSPPSSLARGSICGRPAGVTTCMRYRTDAAAGYPLGAPRLAGQMRLPGINTGVS